MFTSTKINFLSNWEIVRHWIKSCFCDKNTASNNEGESELQKSKRIRVAKEYGPDYAAYKYSRSLVISGCRFVERSY